MPALSEPALSDSSQELSEDERAPLGEAWMEAMYRGDFEVAWQQTDRLELHRRQTQHHTGFTRQPWHLTWDGTPLENRRVLIRCEHGLGDSIQYLRYCEVLQARGCHVTVKAQPHLLSLLRYLRGVDVLLNAWTTDPEPVHDVVIEVMELAYALRNTAATLPKKVAYLDLSEAPRFDLCAGGQMNVGVIWAASDWNPRRSIPLRELAPLAAIPGVRLFSLQQGAQVGDVEKVGFPMTPLSSSTTDLLDAARAMCALDAIVTVDSMTAHLAGALARPTLLLLTHSADWRWMRTGSTSPWYPTCRLLRQASAGSWSEAIVHLVNELGALRAAP